MRMRGSYTVLALASLSAILLILSFPKFELSGLAWVTLVPLLVALEGKSLRGAYFLSYLTGLVFFNGVFYWIYLVPAYNVLDTVLLSIYLPQYVSLWGLGLAWIRKRTKLSAAIVAPPLWVTLEYIRSHLSFLSLPWMLIGHSQYSHPSLIQVTSLTGVYGLTFLIVLANAAIAETILHSRGRSAFGRASLISPMIAGVLLIATSVYGFSVLATATEGERTTIALVQGNIPVEKHWDRSNRKVILDRYAALTRNAAQQAAMLIVWPEAAIPGDIQEPELRRAVAELARDTKTHLLVGSSEYAKFSDRRLQEKYYNSMFLFTPEGEIAAQYRKIALIPFGEYEPLRGIVNWPRAIVSAMGGFLPGDQYTLFTVGGVTFGAVICWETIFPDLVREFVKRGARLIVNGTNESWFYETAVPYQLLAMSAFRATENKVPIVRAANTGITAFIDPFGRITERLRGPNQKELFIEGFLAGTVPLSNEQTFYTRYGDIFTFLQIAICAALLIYSCLTLYQGQNSGITF